MIKFTLSSSAERSNWEDENTKLIWLPHKAVYEFVSRYCHKKIVLDAGCGQGWGSGLVAKVAKKITAIDIDESSLNFARNKFTFKNLLFRKDNLENLNSIKKNPNIIICLQTIEHLNKPHKFLESVVRLLKSNGVLIISTPNKLSDHIPSPYHIKEYSETEIRKLLSNYFKHVKLFGLYEDKSLKKVMDERRKKNKLLLRIDILHINRFLPKFLRSIIFITGSKFVGMFVKKSMKDNFKKIETKNFNIKGGITKNALDIIAVCY